MQSLLRMKIVLKGLARATALNLSTPATNQASGNVSANPLSLPGYVTADIETGKFPQVLTTPAQKLAFPLTAQDEVDIKTLEAKYDAEEGCAGLAAPQIGIHKQIIVFSAPDNPELKKFRRDFTQTMEKTIWLNAEYSGIGEEKAKDYEACFSIPGFAGLVSRHKSIKYKAYTPAGKLIEGEAEGFLARVIQHEIDHTHGILYTDKVMEGDLITMEAYRAMRAAAMASEEPKV